MCQEGLVQVHLLFNSFPKRAWLATEKIGVPDYKHEDLRQDALEAHRDYFSRGLIWWDLVAANFVSNEHSGHYRLLGTSRADFLLVMNAAGFDLLHLPCELKIDLRRKHRYKLAEVNQQNFIREKGESHLNHRPFCSIFAGEGDQGLHSDALYDVVGNALHLKEQYNHCGKLDLNFCTAGRQCVPPAEFHNIFCDIGQKSHSVLPSRGRQQPYP